MTTLLNINTFFCLDKQIKFSHAITELYVLPGGGQVLKRWNI